MPGRTCPQPRWVDCCEPPGGQAWAHEGGIEAELRAGGERGADAGRTLAAVVEAGEGDYTDAWVHFVVEDSGKDPASLPPHSHELQ